MAEKKSTIFLLLLSLGSTIFLTLNRHSRAGIQNYHSEIWADKAGYYIYLPALFIYNFETEKLPPDLVAKTGYGFVLDSGKILTKYSCGVALLQSPFFLAAHFLATYLNKVPNGFSLIYHKAIDIAAVTYSFFALITLYFFLIRYFSKKVIVITLICLYLGTNLFYYSIFETGMSHIYSFFLFSVYLYLGPLVIKPNQHNRIFILFGFIIGLIIMVRPINIIFLPVFFLFNSISISFIKDNLVKLILTFVTLLLVLLPQSFYWKYAFGSFIHYAYGSESFSNSSSPFLLHLWFSTKNGLFIYSPLFVAILVGIFILFKQSSFQSSFLFLYFIFISLLFASWHDWAYGCSYGCRPFVEYYSLFAFPLACFIQKLNLKSIKYAIPIFVMIIFILYTQKLMLSYDGCWSSTAWDWPKLGRLIMSHTK